SGGSADGDPGTAPEPKRAAQHAGRPAEFWQLFEQRTTELFAITRHVYRGAPASAAFVHPIIPGAIDELQRHGAAVIFRRAVRRFLRKPLPGTRGPKPLTTE